MLYHFCFVLVLVAASNGQRYSPITNVLPNNGRLLPRPVPGANPNNIIRNVVDPLFNIGGRSNAPVTEINTANGEDPNGFESTAYPLYRDPNDPEFGRDPDGSDYESTAYPPTRDPLDPSFGRDPNGGGYESTAYPPTRDPLDPSFGRDPNGGGYESTAYPPTRDPLDPSFGRDPNGGGYESTTYPPTRDPNLGNGLNPTTNSNIHVTDSHELDITTKSNDLLSTTGNYVTTTDSNHIYPGSNNTGVTGEKDAVCRRRYGYYKVEGSCDYYLECKNFEVFRRLCPDGMHFNPDAYFPEYPCGYPGDVPCIGRGAIQPSKPTLECQHQFGFFPVTDKSLTPSERCSRYIMCSAGKANVMDCPIGLAFNAATGRCDWPEQVPGCQEYLGFHCPDPGFGEEDLVMNYKYNENNCYYFWSCQNGRARLLSCDYGLAFDPNSGRCVEEDLVHCDDRDDSLEPNHDESTPANAVFLM